MALNTQASSVARNAMMDALAALLAGGFLDIYDGAQPASADVAVTTQVKLARLALGTPAFSPSAAGAASALAIAPVGALANGTAAWFRALKSDGTALWDGSVGLAGTNITVNSTGFVVGAPVTISAWTITEPAAGA